MSGPTGTQKVFDITQYGASPTTSANNSTAINVAIQAALNNGGGVVYIPSGIWPFSDTVNLPFSVSIVGDGQSSQLLYQGAITTLTKDITLNANTITVVSSTQFPPANFYVSIGSEVLLVTATSGTNNTTWTVARAQQGTAPTAAGSGTAVMPVSAILWMDSTPSSAITLETNGNTNAGDSVLSFASTAGVIVGMTVSGQGILAGTYAAAVTPTSVTLTQSASAEVKSGTAITFDPPPRFAGQIADLWLNTNNSPSLIGIKLVDVYGGHMNRIIVTGGFSTAGVVMVGVIVNTAFSHLNQCRIGVSGDGIQLQGKTWVCSALECELSQNGGWGVNAAGGPSNTSSFSVYNCDLEGNSKGGITGNFTVSEFEGNYYENADNPMIRSFQGLLNTDHVLVLGSYPPGNLYFTTSGSPAGSIDTNLIAFQGLDVDNVLVLDNSNNLWLDTGPFSYTLPLPASQKKQIDSNVSATRERNPYLGTGRAGFQGLDSQTVLVLDNSNNLWLETGPFPYPLPPPASQKKQVDANVQAFQGLDSQTVLVLDNSNALWLETGPFPYPLPAPASQKKQMDGNVKAFQGLDENTVLVLGTDGNLWLENGPFGNTVPPPRDHVDSNVRVLGAEASFQALDSQTVLVLGADGNLWLEHGPFGNTVPPPRDHVDSNVLAFQGLDKNAVLVLDNNSALWLESAPFGKANRTLVTPYSPAGGPAFLLGECSAISIKGNRIINWLGPYGMDIGNATIPSSYIGYGLWAIITPITNGNTNVGDSVLSFESTAGITVGMAVSGQGILVGTYVAAVTPTSVTLTQSVSAELKSGTAITFGIDAGIDGCIVEGNQVSYGDPTWPFRNLASVALVGSSGSNVRIRNNQIVSLPTLTWTTTHVIIANWASNIDAGLRMSSFRFAAHDLQPSIPRPHPLSPPPPRQLAVYVPLDQGIATFPTIAMEEPGYVVAVVARLTKPPSPGTWSVQVQINGEPIMTGMDNAGNPIPFVVDTTEQTAEGRPTPLGLYGPSPLGLYDEKNDLDNQFPEGAQLGVAVSTSANWPVGAQIDVVVDVIVGFGGLGV